MALNTDRLELEHFSPHLVECEQVLHKLGVTVRGLSDSEAEMANKSYGLNVLPASKDVTLLEKLWENINSVLVYVLLVGAILSFVFEHLVDGVVILSVVVINVILGVYMENKAEKSTQALKSMMSPSAIVMRNGERVQIEAKLLTVGDIFFLQAGDICPADGRILNSTDLCVFEAALTGEAHAVMKSKEVLLARDDKDATIALAERTNMVYSGTQVLKGTATCVGTAVGSSCEIGKISELMTEVVEKKTPLVLELDRFGRLLSAAIIIIALGALGAAVGRSYTVAEGFAFSIGIAVAAIPEGLPSVVTITFAIGVHFMAKLGAVVKTLPAVETLGSVGVICSDKTGTLTINKMTVKVVCTESAILKLADTGTIDFVEPHSSPTFSSGHMEAQTLLRFVAPGVLCNDSSLLIVETKPAGDDLVGIESLAFATDATNKKHGNHGEYSSVHSHVDLEVGREPQHRDEFTVQGDPTETCITSLAAQLMKPAPLKALLNRCARVAEVPFDSAVKFMATQHLLSPKDALELLSLDTTQLDSRLQDSEGRIMVIVAKGAPERVCHFLTTSGTENDSEEDTNKIVFWKSQAHLLAEQGMRVLGLAYKVVPSDVVLSDEMSSPSGFTVSALIGIIDPPRSEAITSIGIAQGAGINVKMITGDHPVTAVAIGRTLGLRINGPALTGSDIDALIAQSEEAFDLAVVSNDIFARTTPEHKLRILQSLQRQGHVCSMTGDGVNDAPALKAANIGVAMGITGTEVAKDAANMIITDDNFATIVDAIRVGRTTYDNLIKILAFVLPTNGGQSFSIVAALAFGWEVPITALQILWVNLITSITLGLVLAFEKPHAAIMLNPPRRPGKPLFGKFLTWRVFFVTVLLVIAVLGNFEWESTRISSLPKLRTVAINTLSAAQAAYLFNCRHLRTNESIVEIFTGNRMVWIGISVVAMAQAFFTYAPPAQYIFQTEAIDAISWGKIILLSVVLFIVVEAEKYISQAKRTYFRTTANLAE